MKYVSSLKLEPGMRVYRPLYDKNSKLLIGANKILTNNNIKKIITLGYPGIYISESADDFINEIYEEYTLSDKLKTEVRESLEALDIKEILNNSGKVVNEIKSKSSICLDLIELRNYDDYTYAHSLSVAMISVIVGIAMELNDDELNSLCASALLHDIGKIKVQKDIINKPAKLTAEEYEEVKKHSIYSYEIIKDDINVNAKTKVSVLSHHENENGTGYPLGKSGDNIYKLAKIIHVADVYDALISKRPYKKAYSSAEAIEYIMSNVGTMFNKEVVEAFVKHISPYPLGIEVLLSTGEYATVQKTNKEYLLRPEVRTKSGKYIKLNDALNITIVREII